MQDSANDLSVAVGKTVLVDCASPIERVSIGLGDIAEVHATSSTEIMVNGKTPGETSLIIWDNHGGRQFFNVTVRANASVLDDQLDGIRRELSTEFPGQALKVTSDDGIQGRQPARRQGARLRSADSPQGAFHQRRPQQGDATRHQSVQ